MKIHFISDTFNPVKVDCILNQIKNTTDIDLVYHIKHGEKKAYQELFEKYAPKIYHFSFSYLKNKLDAEELVQDVFLKVWEKRETLDTSQNIKAYIFKIAINTIYDFIRRKNIENAFQDFAATNFDTKSNNTWHAIIYNEILGKLNRLVEQFPEQQQKIYKLSKEEGFSNHEIAQKLNLSKRTVENQLYRATAFLKAHFQNESVVALLFFYLW